MNGQQPDSVLLMSCVSTGDKFDWLVGWFSILVRPPVSGENWVPVEGSCVLGSEVSDAELLVLVELTKEPSETGGMSKPKVEVAFKPMLPGAGFVPGNPGDA